MKNFKYLLLCFIINFFFSCQKEVDHVDTVNIRANALLKDTKISLFDRDINIKFSLLNNGVDFNKITVFKQKLVKDGTKKNKEGKQFYKKVENNIGDVVIKDNKEASFNSSILKPFMFKNGNITQEKDVTNAFTFDKLEDEKKGEEPIGTFKFFLNSVLSDGKKLTNLYSINVVHAITLASSVNQVKFKDTISQKIVFSTFEKYTKIDKVTLSWKKGKSGTYVEDTGANFDKNKEIDLKKLDYTKKYNLNIGDTLYYKFTAKSNSLIDTLVTSVAIVPQNMGSSHQVKLSSDTSKLNLKTNSDENPEIQYDSNSNSITKVSASTSSLSFVKVTLPTGVKPDDYFSKGNLDEAKSTFESGTEISSLTNLSKNSVFLYKIKRTSSPSNEEVISYGIIKIGDVVNSGSNKEGVINFKYREGVLVGY